MTKSLRGHKFFCNEDVIEAAWGRFAEKDIF
jgi:hypothetical protein